MSKKKNIYIGAVIILIIIALVLLFSGKVASQKKPDQQNIAPATTEIPANMSISNEVGG